MPPSMPCYVVPPNFPALHLDTAVHAPAEVGTLHAVAASGGATPEQLVALVTALNAYMQTRAGSITPTELAQLLQLITTLLPIILALFGGGGSTPTPATPKS